MSIKEPVIIDSVEQFLKPYDVLLCDVWGVLHGGGPVFPEAINALRRFASRGGTVILVSNAPNTGSSVAGFLAGRGLPRDIWHGIVTSGDLALDTIRASGFQRLYGIGPEDRDAGFFTQLPGRAQTLEQADAIVCTGLNDDVNEAVADYEPLLARALTLKVPFVCANPDLVVDIAGKHHICAGALAEAYEAQGGPVIWCGKPHGAAYATAMAKAAALRDVHVKDLRALGIGDALRTDMAAAQNAGIDGLLVASGIHRNDLMRSGEIDAAATRSLIPTANSGVTALISWLR